MKIGPWYNALEQKYLNQATLYSVDMIDNQESANQYLYSNLSAPVFKFFRNGTEIDRAMVRGGDNIQIDAVYEKIDELLQNNAFQQKEI